MINMDKETPVIVARVWTDGEASVIKSLLDSYRIPSHYASGLPNRLYPGNDPDEAPIRIFVPAAFERDARQVLEEHRRHGAPLRLVDD
jgi:hypothetical protein